MSNWRSVAGVMVATLLAASGCATQHPDAARPRPAPTTAPAAPTTTQPSQEPTSQPAGGGEGTALAQLTTLVVAGRAPMTGYDRDRFGQAWLDADRNGCDTRNDILRRDLHPITVKPGTNGCVVLTGVLADPYTGTLIDFERAVSDSVDIDHVVALGNAWVSGAWRFDIKERAALANDPLNLLAADASANRQKGDANAASWLPPDKSYRCAYVARQIAVKAKYHLKVTPSERATMAMQLGKCPGQPVTADVTRAPTRVDQNISDPGAQPTPTHSSSSGTSSSGSGGSVYYQNCDAARAAGAAPVRRGDPGYDSHLDGDGDGVACE
jgi:hypothetical protein